MTDLKAVREQLKRVGSTKEQLILVEFLEKKHRENHFVSYWQPTPQQAKHFGEFTADTKIFGILGGNRSGKTEEGAFLAMVWFLGKEYFRGTELWQYVEKLPVPDPPNNIWLVGLDFATLRDVIWREKLRNGRLHPGLLPKDDSLVKRISDYEFQVFGHNGSVITGKSADSGREKFQGASVDLVWIDEEPEVEIFEECYQRTVDCAGKILLTLTPLTDIASGVRTPWVFDLWEEFKTGKKDVKFVQLSVLENPYVPEEEKIKLLEQWKGHPEERARLYGEFVHRSGLVYPMWKPALHMVKPTKLPTHWRRIVSIDPAATGTTAAVWSAISDTNDIWLYREYYERDRIVSEHAKSMLLRNSGDPIDIWLIDPKWGAQRNAADHRQNYQLYRESGIPVRLATVDEDYGLNAAREYLNATSEKTSRHPKVYVFDNLSNFRYEIEHYTWATFERGEQKGQSKEKPVKRNDHLMNAFQYLCAMRPKGKRIGSFQFSSEADKKAASQLNSYT